LRPTLKRLDLTKEEVVHSFEDHVGPDLWSEACAVACNYFAGVQFVTGYQLGYLVLCLLGDVNLCEMLKIRIHGYVNSSPLGARVLL